MENSSRLARLFDLIENASNLETRTAAAEQIAGVFGAQDEFVSGLLGRVVPLCGAGSWDTRVAAALLLGLVARSHFSVLQLPSSRAVDSSVLALLEAHQVLGSGKTIHGSEPDRKRLKESSGSAPLRVSGAMKLKERELAKSSDAVALANVVVADEERPWTRLAEHLISSAVSERWEARHGALLAIKALIEAAPASGAEALVSAFFGCAFHVLVLDRFNDFMSDRVMAPVREVAAQVVGLLMERASEQTFNRLLGCLMDLIQQEDWQLRHAGLLALRFFTNRRNVVLHQLAPLLIEPMLGALDAEDDDVIAVAAEVMLPAAALVCEHSLDAVGMILDRIWDLVESLNEISASIGCLLRLMAAFYNVPQVAAFRPLGTEKRICLLFALFRHGVSSVRLAVVELFAELLVVGRPEQWAMPWLGNMFQACFHSFATETDEQVLSAIGTRLWRRLIEHGSSEQVCAVASPLMLSWFTLLSSEVKDCESFVGMRVNGARAIAELLCMWPKDKFPMQVLTLIKLLCSPSAKERLVGGLTLIRVFAPGNSVTGIAENVCQAFCQKVQESLLGDWTNLILSEDVDVLWEKVFKEFGKLKPALGSQPEFKHPLQVREACVALQQTGLPGQLQELCVYVVELCCRWVSACSPRHRQVEGATTVAWLCLWLASRGRVVQCAATERAVSLLQRAALSESEPLYRKEWANGMVTLLLNSEGAVIAQYAPTVLRDFASAVARDRRYTPLAGASLREEQEDVVGEDEAEQQQQQQQKQSDPILCGRQSAIVFFNTLGERLGRLVLLKDSPLLAPLWLDVVDALKENAPIQSKIDALRLVQVLLRAVPLNVSCQRETLAVLELLCSTMPWTGSCWEAQSVLGEAIAAASRLCPVDVLRHLCLHVLPKSQDGSLNQSGNVALIASIHRVLQELHIQACPFLAFMVVPVLGSMSHRDESVRHVAASAFAQIVSLMPLEAGTPDPPGFGKDLSERRLQERVFIQQLLGGEPPAVDEAMLGLLGEMKLRPYQHAGISWLCFLARYQLHGILADDMGLGKTVQALCSISHSLSRSNGRPSLIVCPSSLVHHWINEATSLFKVFKPFAYEGSMKERKDVSMSDLRANNLIVVSYETLRRDIAKFEGVDFMYCVLDEGHIIRNPTSLVTLACKRVRATHRLILSGTPLQNDVVELWSLFDFLTPGYLGTQKEFRATFGKFISASKDPKAKKSVRERGTLALEALHRQMLPFIMRRTKETVLKDLPPKVIQDYCCDMSPLQSILYDGLASAEVGSTEKEIHEFQRLQLLRKLCNHPSMVLEKCSAGDKLRASSLLQEKNLRIDDAVHSGKLMALQELLQTCGIGLEEEGNCDAIEPVRHRVLVFCQIGAAIDLIENLLLKHRMPRVTYLRLDGSVPQQERFSMVKRFNSDPTIDLMLLTVKVGGLGLNLTGADTVIFFESDWNPQIDLQAMDRAHRLGQKRMVNVYRLITRRTMEEHILSLQQFKLKVARAVVNEENAAMATMDTSALLDLANTGAMDTGADEDEDEAELARYKEMTKFLNE